MELDSAELLKRLPPGALTCSAVMGLLFWGAFWAIFAGFFQKNLAALPEEDRRMKPAAAWWLVPFPVAMVFLFFVVVRISDSWKSHLARSTGADPGKCGKTIGLTSAAFALLSNLLSLQPFIGGGGAVTTVSQVAAGLLGLAGFVLLVVYAILLNDLKLKSQRAVAAAPTSDS